MAADGKYEGITGLTADGWSFTIEKAPISFTAGSNTHKYGGEAHSAVVTQSAGQSLAISGEKFTVTYKLPFDGSGTATRQMPAFMT